MPVLKGLKALKHKIIKELINHKWATFPTLRTVTIKK